jgi:hypothetical protein
MRTTVSIGDDLLDKAKGRARQRNQTLGQYLEDAIRLDLARAVPREIPPLPVMSGSGGMNPRIDPTSNASLLEFEEEGVELDQMR